MSEEARQTRYLTYLVAPLLKPAGHFCWGTKQRTGRAEGGPPRSSFVGKADDFAGPWTACAVSAGE